MADRAATPKRSGVRDRQREATRASILEQALIVFAEQGYDGGSTRDIAARAGVNHAMIKYHFESKEQLWKAAVSYLFERLAREVAFPPERIRREFEGDRRAFGEAFLREYVHYCARHPEHARLMIQESVRDGALLDWMTRNHSFENKRDGELFVSLMQHEGLLPQGSIPVLVYMLVGACQLIYALAPEVRRSWDFDPTRPEVVDAHVDLVLRIFLRGGWSSASADDPVASR